VTGVSRFDVIKVAREFANTADKTKGRSMIIVGAALNHWYHMDMNYRRLINMLMMCGCVGQSGGGWAHYVGYSAHSLEKFTINIKTIDS
jgi:nitrate reductase alpha subunit